MYLDYPKEWLLVSWNLVLCEQGTRWAISWYPQTILLHIQGNRDTDQLYSYFHKWMRMYMFCCENTYFIWNDNQIATVLGATKKIEFQENQHFKKEKLVNRELTLSFSQENG